MTEHLNRLMTYDSAFHNIDYHNGHQWFNVASEAHDHLSYKYENCVISATLQIKLGFEPAASVLRAQPSDHSTKEAAWEYVMMSKLVDLPLIYLYIIENIDSPEDKEEGTRWRPV